MSEFINAVYVAKTIEGILGPRFYVEINSVDYVYDEENNEHPEQQGRTRVAMKINRVPFSIDTKNNETLEIEIEINAETKNEKQKAEVMEDIKKLLGTTTGEIGVDDSRYLYSMFLQQDKPMSPPHIEGGQFHSFFYIRGTMLLSKPAGAIVSNRIQTFINSKEIKTIAVRVSMEKQVESPVMSNETEPTPAPKSHVVSYAIQALFEDNDICNEIAKDINLVNAEQKLEKTYHVRRVYPQFAVEKTMLAIGGQLIEDAGAYAQFTLTLQEM